MNHMLDIDHLLETSKEEFGRYDWDGTFAEYLDGVEENLGVNVGALVGHSALRRYVIGLATLSQVDLRRHP